MTDTAAPAAGFKPLRRRFLALLALGIASRSWSSDTSVPDTGTTTTATPFSFDGLIAAAQDLARHDFVPDLQPDQAVLDRIDWNAHGQIHFKADTALFADGPGQYPVEFFHPGRFFRNRVRMYRLDAALDAAHPTTQAHEIPYSADLFDMPADSPAHAMNAQHAGFAGFRVQESRTGGPGQPDWRTNDWAAFLGASYFRAIGDQYQYGLSARGVAVNTIENGVTEEFPAFTRFYFEPGAADSHTIVIYALLDGPSLAGAYRFTMTREQDVRMDVEARLFLRRDIARFGIAPATSMYWFSGKDKPRQIDWRPQVHDSDGLAMWTGRGERLWRPLNDPAGIRLSVFTDHNPRGFGLMQRQRHYDRYLDAVHYERRPGLWIEPLDDWGDGSVQLIELHTAEEIYDNIVAMWVPATAATAGSSHTLRYRLYWAANEPDPGPLARCVATRIGRGGEPGSRPADSVLFVVEFEGALLASLPQNVQPQADISASRGQVAAIAIERDPDGNPAHWRARFELRHAPAGDTPVELRLALRNADQILSETWLYAHPVT